MGSKVKPRHISAKRESGKKHGAPSKPKDWKGEPFKFGKNDKKNLLDSFFKR